jgi:hypothetical protein
LDCTLQHPSAKPSEGVAMRSQSTLLAKNAIKQTKFVTAIRTAILIHALAMAVSAFA